MDLNQLIRREGEERMRAAIAACGRSRDAHLGLADLFRERVANRRLTLFGAGFGAQLVPPAL